MNFCFLVFKQLYPKDKLKHTEDSSEYSDTDDDDEDESYDDGGGVAIFRPHAFPAPVPAPAPVLFGFGTPVFGVARAFKTVCRQCPEYKEPANNNVAGIVEGVKTAVHAVKNFILGNGIQTTTETRAGTTASTEESVASAESQEPVTKEDPSFSAPVVPGTSDESKEPASGEEPSTSGTGGPGPSTSGDGTNGATAAKAQKPFKDDPKEMPTAPNHVCAANQNHVLCQCCLQPFPDFRLGINYQGQDGNRPQQCGICYRAYCHAYWGCRKADCLGCLNQFKEMNFGRKSLAGLILDNQFESEIFKDYIDSKGLSVKDVLQECCKQMDAGKFSVPAQGTHRLTSETPVCYACGLNNFKQLAFQYRKTLKTADLPVKALNRPDCYWGSKCRTQRNKPHHARNFNHICDQTRQF